jgi:hypothetical protein
MPNWIVRPCEARPDAPPGLEQLVRIDEVIGESDIRFAAGAVPRDHRQQPGDPQRNAGQPTGQRGRQACPAAAGACSGLPCGDPSSASIQQESQDDDGQPESQPALGPECSGQTDRQEECSATATGFNRDSSRPKQPRRQRHEKRFGQRAAHIDCGQTDRPQRVGQAGKQCWPIAQRPPRPGVDACRAEHEARAEDPLDAEYGGRAHPARQQCQPVGQCAFAPEQIVRLADDRRPPEAGQAARQIGQVEKRTETAVQLEIPRIG